MLVYVKGDLFTSPAQVLVNTVNTVGVMGKGIAKTFKEIYPDMFLVYQRYCELGELKPGSLLIYKTNHKWILNFPTKRHWRNRSRIEDIELGLQHFVSIYREWEIASIAFPQLGCGNGELDWEADVRPLMEKYLQDLPIEVFIHVYVDGSLVPEHRDVRQMTEWLRSEPQSLPFEMVWEDLKRTSGLKEAPSDSHPGFDSASDDETFEFDTSDRTVMIRKGDMFDVWQRLRAVGFLGTHDLPTSACEHSGAFFELLESLPYVERATFVALNQSRGTLAESTQEMFQRIGDNGVRLFAPVAGSLNADRIVSFGAKQMAIALNF